MAASIKTKVSCEETSCWAFHLSLSDMVNLGFYFKDYIGFLTSSCFVTYLAGLSGEGGGRLRTKLLESIEIKTRPQF